MIATDWAHLISPQDGRGDGYLQHGRGRKFSDSDDGITDYFWVASRLSSAEFDAVLTAVADDEGQAIVTDMAAAWLYVPYDGGADVLLPTTLARDALQDLHPDWLPPAL